MRKTGSNLVTIILTNPSREGPRHVPSTWRELMALFGYGSTGNDPSARCARRLDPRALAEITRRTLTTDARVVRGIGLDAGPVVIERRQISERTNVPRACRRWRNGSVMSQYFIARWLAFHR